MLQRVRTLLSGLAGEEPATEEGTSWFQRMTYEGGWERRLANFAPREFRERPTSDDDLRMTLPGRYRAIRQQNGRLGEPLWKYETADAEEYYERQRR